MRWDEMWAAVAEARQTIRVADGFTQQMGDMIKGKLRSGEVNSDVLASFKRELKDFDLRTHMWKDQ